MAERGKDRSVSRQLEAIKDYCARHGLKLRHIFKDVAKSGGTTAGRDEFDRMISSTRNEADRPVAILLWNYARFARDLDDSTYYKALLRSKRGIIIHSLTDHIPEGPYGKFVEILIDISNEEKRRQTSIDAADGLRSIVAQGAIPGTPPRGFMREPIITINPRTGQERKNHRWVPDPKQIRSIRKAFQMRAAGASLNEIQKACKLFSTINSYSTFFRNPIYYGTLVYGGITHANYCKPIVQKALWDKVQLIQDGFAQSKNVKSGDHTHPRRQASEFLLSGFARCALCGSPLYGSSSHQKENYIYQSYLCTLAYRKRGSCSKNRIPKEAFETAVINAIADVLIKPENIVDAYRLLDSLNAGLASEQRDQRRDILARLASNKKKRTNLADAISENGSSPTLQSSLNALEHQKLELDMELAEFESAIIQPMQELTPAQLHSRMKRIVPILQSKDAAQKKTFLRGFLAQVDVERKENLLDITIYYYLPTQEDELDPPDQDDDPTDEYVPTPHHPPGSPVRRHIMQYHFIASTKRPD